MCDPVLKAPDFPKITCGNFIKTSERTADYNCIAHALGDYTRVWWPHQNTYWPPGCPLIATISAFDSMFFSLGYRVCNGGQFEPGFDKVALYALAGAPKHAARQVAEDRWSSKIGRYIDIEHSLDAIEGPGYGYVVKFYKKQLKKTAI